MDHAYWGPEFDAAAIRRALDAAGLRYRELPEEGLCRETARHVAEGRIVGWFQGRMEWGPPWATAASSWTRDVPR